MTRYIGRFAPSPTGPLHIGSLIAALASYLDAKSNNGQWLLRMEDIDPPREMPTAADSILHNLQAHGLQWDGDVLWQSQRYQAYQSYIDELLERGLAFYCSCSRAQLLLNSKTYQPHCQGLQTTPSGSYSIRLRLSNQTLSFDDAIQGPFSQQLLQEVGDVVLKRRDGLFAYQLAVVVDDAWQQVNHIVRGSDLLDSTPRQLYLQRLLAFNPPTYAHFPVICNQQGQKLSKQTFAKALRTTNTCDNLLEALAFLQQPIPPPPQRHNPQDILQWAVNHWALDAISKTLQIKQSNN